MKLYVTLSKRNIALLLAAVIALLVITGQLFTLRSHEIDGSTHAIRKAYLEGLGIEIEESGISSKNIIIPTDFGDVYGKYNRIQKQAGFDLENYKGRDATVYTYILSGDDDKQVHLIVADGLVIGGDVASVKLNGEIKPLK